MRALERRLLTRRLVRPCDQRGSRVLRDDSSFLKAASPPSLARRARSERSVGPEPAARGPAPWAYPRSCWTAARHPRPASGSAGTRRAAICAAALRSAAGDGRAEPHVSAVVLALRRRSENIAASREGRANGEPATGGASTDPDEAATGSAEVGPAASRPSRRTEPARWCGSTARLAGDDVHDCPERRAGPAMDRD